MPVYKGHLGDPRLVWVIFFLKNPLFKNTARIAKIKPCVAFWVSQSEQLG